MIDDNSKANLSPCAEELEQIKLDFYDLNVSFINLRVDRDGWMNYAKELESRLKKSGEALDKACNLLAELQAEQDIESVADML